MSKPTKMISCTLIFFSAILSLQSNSWWASWVLLELSTLGMILNMITKNMEKTLVFFLFQTLSSLGLLVAIFFLSWTQEQGLNKNIALMMVGVIFLKISMFPFHTWMEKIIMNFSWNNLLLLMTWQKMIPLILLSKISNTKNMTLMLSLSTLWVSTILLMNSLPKKMMFLSSLAHNGWMMIPLKMMKALSMSYLLLYSLVVIPIMAVFKKNFSKSILLETSKTKKLEELLNMFSLAGIPPTTGFVAKVLVFLSMTMWGLNKATFALLFLSACMSFFIYFTIFIKIFSGLKKIKLKKMCNNFKKSNTEKLFIATPIMMI